MSNFKDLYIYTTYPRNDLGPHTSNDQLHDTIHKLETNLYNLTEMYNLLLAKLDDEATSRQFNKTLKDVLE